MLLLTLASSILLCEIMNEKSGKFLWHLSLFLSISYHLTLWDVQSSNYSKSLKWILFSIRETMHRLQHFCVKNEVLRRHCCSFWLAEHWPKMRVLICNLWALIFESSLQSSPIMFRSHTGTRIEQKNILHSSQFRLQIMTSKLLARVVLLLLFMVSKLLRYELDSASRW